MTAFINGFPVPVYLTRGQVAATFPGGVEELAARETGAPVAPLRDGALLLMPGAHYNLPSAPTATSAAIFRGDGDAFDEIMRPDAGLLPSRMRLVTYGGNPWANPVEILPRFDTFLDDSRKGRTTSSQGKAIHGGNTTAEGAAVVSSWNDILELFISSPVEGNASHPFGPNYLVSADGINSSGSASRDVEERCYVERAKATRSTRIPQTSLASRARRTHSGTQPPRRPPWNFDTCVQHEYDGG